MDDIVADVLGGGHNIVKTVFLECGAMFKVRCCIFNVASLRALRAKMAVDSLTILLLLLRTRETARWSCDVSASELACIRAALNLSLAIRLLI